MQLNYWITHRSKRKLNFKIPYFLALTAITKPRRRRRRRNRRGLGRWNDNSSSKYGDDHGPRHGDGRRRRPHGRMAPHDPPPLLQTPRQGLPPFSLFLFCDPFFFVLFGCCCCCLDLVVGGILFLMMLLFLIIIVVVVVVFFLVEIWLFFVWIFWLRVVWIVRIGAGNLFAWRWRYWIFAVFVQYSMGFELCRVLRRRGWRLLTIVCVFLFLFLHFVWFVGRGRVESSVWCSLVLWFGSFLCWISV